MCQGSLLNVGAQWLFQKQTTIIFEQKKLMACKRTVKLFETPSTNTSQNFFLLIFF